MPTQTFANLDTERREAFIEAAFDEFIKYDYEHASVTQIVKRLGIGKGSAYRYFESKKDLYFHLMEIAQQKKMAYVMPVMENPSSDFFEMYRELFAAGMRFTTEQPRYSHFLYNVSLERNSQELGNIMLENKHRSLEAFQAQIEAQQQKGVIRTDIPVDLLAFMVVQVGVGVVEYLQLKYGKEIQYKLQDRDYFFKVAESELEEIAQAMIEMMKHGIATKGPSN